MQSGHLAGLSPRPLCSRALVIRRPALGSFRSLGGALQSRAKLLFKVPSLSAVIASHFVVPAGTTGTRLLAAERVLFIVASCTRQALSLIDLFIGSVQLLHLMTRPRFRLVPGKLSLINRAASWSAIPINEQQPEAPLQPVPRAVCTLRPYCTPAVSARRGTSAMLMFQLDEGRCFRATTMRRNEKAQVKTFSYRSFCRRPKLALFAHQ